MTAGTGPPPQYAFDANNRLTASGFTYDAAGNIVNDSSHAYTYDGENRIVQVDSSTATYAYDAAGRRVSKIAGSNKFEYLFDLQDRAITELVAGTATTNRSEGYAGGRHLVTQSPSTTYFIHSDWLGTERARTNLTGGSSETCSSLAYGDALTCTGSDVSPLHFTGKMHDTETGLDEFPARYYSSSQGRWYSPDWASAQVPIPYADMHNPQTLNLYGYVGSNPTNHADPDGHENSAAPAQISKCPAVAASGAPCTSSPTEPESKAEVDQNRQAQNAATQQQPADQKLTNVVYNESGSLRADNEAKPGAPGSAEDLANGRQAVAEIANRVIDAGHPNRVAPSDLTDKAAVKTDAYAKSRTAADAALNGSNISNGATQYRTRVGDNVTTPVGRSSTNPGTPVS